MPDAREGAVAPTMEVIPRGHWRDDGTFQEPEGWPEGAGWVVRDGPGGEIVQWGPASDLQLVATTDTGNEGPMPPADQLGAAVKGVPVAPGEDSPE